MGQILHVGIHRRKGPQGGTLAAIGDTGLLAERVEAGGKWELTVWRPTDRNRPEAWERDRPESSLECSRTGRTATFLHNGRPQTVTFRTPLEDRMDLRTTADWVIRPRLLKLPGIAEVIIMGGDKKQYQVLVDPEKLQEYNVSLQEVEQRSRPTTSTPAVAFWKRANRTSRADHWQAWPLAPGRSGRLAQGVGQGKR